MLRDGSSAAWSLGRLSGSEEVLVGERGNQEAATGEGHQLGHLFRLQDVGRTLLIFIGAPIVEWSFVMDRSGLWQQVDGVDFGSVPVGFGPQARRYGLGSKRPFSCRAGVGLPAIGAESCRAERQSCPRRDRMLGKGPRSEA